MFTLFRKIFGVLGP